MRNFINKYTKTARKFDRYASELNSLLLVVALGLAVLDVTCLTALRIGNPFGAVDLTINAPVKPASINDLVR